MFCNHNWVVLDEFNTKSIAETAIDLGMKVKVTTSTDLVYTEVRIINCIQCGKLKTISVKSGGM